jgi:hypothetical protein
LAAPSTLALASPLTFSFPLSAFCFEPFAFTFHKFEGSNVPAFESSRVHELRVAGCYILVFSPQPFSSSTLTFDLWSRRRPRPLPFGLLL